MAENVYGDNTQSFENNTVSGRLTDENNPVGSCPLARNVEDILDISPASMEPDSSVAVSGSNISAIPRESADSSANVECDNSVVNVEQLLIDEIIHTDSNEETDLTLCSSSYVEKLVPEVFVGNSNPEVTPVNLTGSNISTIPRESADSSANVETDNSVINVEQLIDEIIHTDSNEEIDLTLSSSSYVEKLVPKVFVGNSNPEVTPVNFRNLGETSSRSHVTPVEFIDLTDDDPWDETSFQNVLHDNGLTKETRLNILLDVLPDADIDYLRDKIDMIMSDEEFHLFVSNAIEYQDYPKKDKSKKNKESRSVLITDEKVAGSDHTASSSSSLSNLPHTVTSSTVSQPGTSELSSNIVNLPVTPTVTSYITHPSLYSVPQVTFAVNQIMHPHTVSFDNSGGVASHITLPHIAAGPPVSTEAPIAVGHSSTVQIQDYGTMVHMGTTAHEGMSVPINSSFPINGNVEHSTNIRTAGIQHNLTPTVIINQQVQGPFTQYGTARTGHIYVPNRVNVPYNMHHAVQPRNGHIRRRRNVRPDRHVLPNIINELFPGMNNLYNVGYMPADLRIPRLNDAADGREKSKPKSPADERYKLICDILYLADHALLKKEVKKLKNDDDVDNYLLHAFATEKTWKCGIPMKGLQLDKSFSSPASKQSDKYKILLELLPNASPTFLKRESVKLRTDEDVHEFALKLGRDQSYPKRKNSPLSKSKRKASELIEVGNSEAIDPKYETLKELLPDADPDYLLKESKLLESNTDIEKFVLQSVEKNNYPKRDEFLKRQEYYKQWKKYIENFNIEEFLKLFPNPIRYFYIEKINSKNALNIPIKFLQHRYSKKKSNLFGVVYVETRHNLSKTCDRLELHYTAKPRKYTVWDQETIFSTSLLQEIAFIQNKTEIAHYILFKDKMKLEAYEKAKTEGMLQECGCCYDEKLPDDMANCNEGHVFCLSCIKSGSEVVIGNGGCTFPCYSDGCKEEFSLDIVKNVLNPEIFSRMLTRKQYEEVNAAGISGLETCNFCEFCSIPPPEDKLFHCLNPSCMKITCRSCRKLDHLPLSCEEFAEKCTKLKMQSYVEDKMTEALVRTCWQCGAKFVKESGCNMMQCKCGAKMCYFCRQPVDNYDHFAQGKCGQNMDTTAHDKAAVLEVGKKAKEEMEAANPGIHLAIDPTKLLKNVKKSRKV